MQCPMCKSEVLSAPSVCPRCGTIVSTTPVTKSLATVRIIAAAAIVVGALFLMVTSWGFFFLAISGRLAKLWPMMGPTPRREFAVVHGQVIGPEDLHANGQLYFVPMGRQVIPVQSLAEYYDKKFNLTIQVLDPVPLDLAACLPARRQCIAEEMILSMKRAYPKIAADPDAVMIILTDEDLYPRSLGWKFTYSFHAGYQFAVVSTHRMDPAFWGDRQDEGVRMRSTRQMLTDYIAFLYFRIPRSYDPTSVMYWPFTPNGGSDDLYESDLHSEASANGLRGSGYPCLTFTYSYNTNEITSWPRFVSDCYENANPRSTQQETLQIELAHGQFVQRAMDFQLDSTPEITFRRAYLSQYTIPMAFGLGSNHTYNTWLYSDGANKLSFMDIIHEDGLRNHLQRVSSGKGFFPGVVFEDRQDSQELYGARMTWDSDHFKLTLRDGSWFTYLPCDDGRCFWIGYEDSDRHSLRFERDANRALQRVTTMTGDGLEFQTDAKGRITEGTDSKGYRLNYEYDPAGCLWRVHHPDGLLETYSYDSAHRMNQIAVARPGSEPAVILSLEYDSSGRASTLKLPDGRIYTMKYLAATKDHVTSLSITGPSGKAAQVTIGRDGYDVRATPIRFPAVSAANVNP